MVGVHVGQLEVNQLQDLVLGLLLLFSYPRVHNPLRLLTQPRVATHLKQTQYIWPHAGDIRESVGGFERIRDAFAEVCRLAPLGLGPNRIQ